MSNKKIGIIGLGLIGGSLAKTIKHKKIPVNITAYDTNEKSLLEAKEEGIIDFYSKDIDKSFCNMDIIFLCTPVQNNNSLLDKLQEVVSNECIITDVGSTKQNIHNVISNTSLNKSFVGGHPMAGSEKSGYKNSSCHLFENAFYVLTPSGESSKEKVNTLYSFIETIGSIPIILDPNQHDFTTAGISHVPHVIASSLVNLVQSIDNHDIMKQLAAGGFKDITRIASSSPTMWQQICMSNKENIIEILEKYIAQLNKFNKILVENDSKMLYDFFDNANNYRNTLADPSRGLLKKSYELTVDIIDEPGVIAKIATLLSEHNINIKNIGIVHNRDYEKGVLKIIYYDQKSLTESVHILEKLNYTIYIR